MRDTALIDKKLAFMETCVRELKELARPERMAHDVREARFIQHTLQLAIQAALDVASHIVSARRLGEPETNRALFDLLRREGLVEQDLAEALHAMAGFMNVLVHSYAEVELRVVDDILENHLDDLLAFTEQIRKGLAV